MTYRDYFKDVTLLVLLPALLLLLAGAAKANSHDRTDSRTLLTHSLAASTDRINTDDTKDDVINADTDPTNSNDDLSEAEIGKMLFFDKNLSYNRTMSCATCHDPAKAFSDHRLSSAHGSVSQGSNSAAFGVRNTPTATYANTSPTFHFDSALQEFVGGQFWDGRSATLAQQSMGPPLDTNEMAMPSAVAIVQRLQENPIYEKAFKEFYGDNIFYIQDSYSKYRKLSDPKELPNAFIAMGNFIEAFEKTAYFSPFDSKFDRYLQGQYQLSAKEEAGRKLFFEDPQVNCRNCHMQKTLGASRDAFTNHRFRNVGAPPNPILLTLHGDNPDFIDLGMMNNTHANEPRFKGKFKTPTLRNIELTAPYMHNGAFRELRTVIEFFDHYNNPARKINPETGEPWAEPEVPETIDRTELAGRALSDNEIDALVAFFYTLTDQRYEHSDTKATSLKP
ncbi:cytochrome-c peroxidase [Psychrobacter pygoscelis]|uniref:cytochrome-c peroxidase n=1 Tax=Psychrobacter pygoscelis TaxID=2488563 RepID=UPI001F608B61|nr:cytochrome c peroxidase [Psychrobacter pygoscelis]